MGEATLTVHVIELAMDTQENPGSERKYIFALPGRVLSVLLGHSRLPCKRELKRFNKEEFRRLHAVDPALFVALLLFLSLRNIRYFRVSPVG